MRHWRQRGLVALALLITLPAYADGYDTDWYDTNWYYEVDKRSTWQGDLTARLQAIGGVFDGELGVYVQNLANGEAYSWRADDPWYLAPLIKVPVAAQVLTERQAGTLSLDERLTLSRSDKRWLAWVKRYAAVVPSASRDKLSHRNINPST